MFIFRILHGKRMKMAAIATTQATKTENISLLVRAIMGYFYWEVMWHFPNLYESKRDIHYIVLWNIIN